MGITVDEWQRAKDSDVGYIRHAYPLLDLGMTRDDCVTWLRDRDLPSPGKSSCVFCPFQTRRAWEELRRENGEDWRRAVAVDEEIRDARLPGQLFVHSRAIPLVAAVREPGGWEQGGFFEADAECDSGFCFG
jgi:hypothetical protein